MAINLAPPTTQDLLAVLPETILTLGGLLLMVLEVLPNRRPEDSRSSLAWLSIFILGAAGLASLSTGSGEAYSAFNGMIRADGYAAFFRLLCCVSGMVTILLASPYLFREKAEGGEFYALILFSVVGQCLLAASTELVLIFIGIEISSIASYILAGYLRDDKRGSEAALKYFLMGSFATAFLLYGVAWIYGLTGSTNINDIAAYLGNRDVRPDPLFVGVALALMLTGFGFKVSAAPFHVWSPDVYQGAPAPVSAFLAAAPKAAAFAVFARVLQVAFPSFEARWIPLLWVSALLTMLIGNFGALRQTNTKRLLAYSSIAHAGYVLVAMTTANNTGLSAMMFYLATYALVNAGTFGIVAWLARENESSVGTEAFDGLGESSPGLALLMTIYLCSLIGIPLTAGFYGKFYIFKAAMEAGHVWLTVLGLLSSAVAAWYYLRILARMWMQPAAAGSTAESIPGSFQAALWLSAAATLLFGIFPTPLMDWATRSIATLR
jgi:NADH-quinone oxidoreductase subunit N